MEGCSSGDRDRTAAVLDTKKNSACDHWRSSCTSSLERADLFVDVRGSITEWSRCLHLDFTFGFVFLVAIR